MTVVADENTAAWRSAAVADQAVNAGGSGTRTASFNRQAALSAVLVAVTPDGTTPPNPPPEPPAPTPLGAARGANTGSASSITLTLPAGIVANDQILVAVEIAQTVTANLTPSGYTTVTDLRPSTSARPRLVVMRRTATGGETSLVVPTGRNASAAVAIVYRGVSASAPVAATSTGSAQGTSVSTGSLSAPTANSTLVTFLGARNHTAAESWTAPTSMLKRVDENAAAGRSAAICDQTVGSGATGSRTATFGVSGALSAVSVVLRRA
jgi:hypothetical protein